MKQKILRLILKIFRLFSNPQKKELRLWLMENTRNDALERKEAFSTVTREEMIDFVKSLRESAWCQMQVEGNFYEKEAIKLFDSAIKTLGGMLNCKTQYVLTIFEKKLDIILGT